MTIKSWSYSRLQAYEQCPLKAKFKYVDNLKEPPNQAMVRGIHVHEQLEAYLNYEFEEVPREGLLFAKSLRELRDAGAEAEVSYTFKDDWSLTTWNANDAWLRLKLDVIVEHRQPQVEPWGFQIPTIHIVDFKTGQCRMDHSQQLELYALAAIKVRPGFAQYVTENWYIDSNQRTITVFKPEQEADLQRKWEKKTLPMLTDVHFEATPNVYCKYCHFSAAKGGPCLY